ncbi:MAG: PIN domain nuclease [Gammaproteobacteria bacterium]|nr:MAG: PIN domain nuclease [Gammaproteobacteria bacterium]
MTIIIDTHVFLWLLNNPSCIKPEHMECIENTANKIFLSSMSVAELMIKKSIGKLNFDFNILQMAENMGIEILDFTGLDALQLETLPLHHKDPFDRMIIAQARSNRFSIITYDSKFGFYDCQLI